MAVFHGKAGNVNFNASDLFDINAWTLSTSCDIAETTAMGDSWQSFYHHASTAAENAGLTTFTATAEGLGETTADLPALIATEAALKLEVDATHYFGANAIMVSITETCSIDDVGRVSYAFEGDDTAEIAYT
jgi:hypothetical protein